MILNMISYFLIPFFSLALARGTDWFQTNFSVISISLSRQIGFVLWSATVGFYFFLCLRRIILHMETEINMAREGRFLFTAGLLLIAAIIAPYLPERFPRMSWLHVASSFVASLLLFFCIFSICLKLYFIAPGVFRCYLITLFWVAVLSICLFMRTGIINSAMEILFTISCTIVVRRLYRKVVSGKGNQSFT